MKCSAKSSYDNINALKKNCLSKFSDCKKAEDNSVGLIQVCNGRTTPSTATAMAPTTAALAPTTAAVAPTAAGKGSLQKINSVKVGTLSQLGGDGP